MNLRSTLRAMRSYVLSSCFKRTVPLGTLGPVVSFTFDDFPQSALSVGADILERFGARATYYVAMGLENTANDLGVQFRRDDLVHAVSRGHELAVHGFQHLSARRTPVEAFVRDVVRCETEMRQQVSVGVSRNFAYPYGEVTLSTKQRLGPLMMSSRGTIGGLNGPDVDLNLLRANRLYGDVNQLESIKQLISQVQREASWLIFYTHDVAERPSKFGCTPGLLESTASFAAERSCRLMTVADVVNRIGSQT
jgi:peptidoglycan/xylan/chitin deacetylase (PgdA/CDA1 family)